MLPHFLLHRPLARFFKKGRERKSSYRDPVDSILPTAGRHISPSSSSSPFISFVRDLPWRIGQSAVTFADCRDRKGDPLSDCVVILWNRRNAVVVGNILCIFSRIEYVMRPSGLVFIILLSLLYLWMLTWFALCAVQKRWSVSQLARTLAGICIGTGIGARPPLHDLTDPSIRSLSIDRAVQVSYQTIFYSLLVFFERMCDTRTQLFPDFSEWVFLLRSKFPREDSSVRQNPIAPISFSLDWMFFYFILTQPISSAHCRFNIWVCLPSPF